MFSFVFLRENESDNIYVCNDGDKWRDNEVMVVVYFGGVDMVQVLSK